MLEVCPLLQLAQASAICAVLLVGASSAVQAQTARAADGCPTPTYSSSGRDFYVDPVRGSMQGDGSQSRPWHTFSEVLAAGLITSQTRGANATASASLKPVNPRGVVRGGDTIHLMNGDY